MKNTERYWLGLLLGSAVLAFAVAPAAQAYELEKCNWLANTAYTQAHYRDMGATLAQYKVLVRFSAEREETKVGQLALAKYVYAHPERSPDDLSDDLMQDCLSYDR